MRASSYGYQEFKSRNFTVGIKSLLSWAYMMMPRPICFRLLAQLMRKARSLAFDNAGNNIAARMAMMAMTTSSSINVNPACGRRENLQRFMRNFDLQLWTHIGAMNLRSRFRFLESAAGSLFMVCFQIAD